MQEKITIINVKKSTEILTFEQTIFKSAWVKNESRLRTNGWLPKDDIKTIEYEKVDDGLEFDEVVVEEEKVVVEKKDDFSSYSLDELKAACDERGIKYHHAHKQKKLISLLEA